MPKCKKCIGRKDNKLNENLINYLEFLENSSKFKAMDKAAKAQMLSQINELIKSEALWVRNSHKDESKRQLKKLFLLDFLLK
ncbi:hypothetical protein [Campylobacter lanienae]|uniref:hypothetical protein n=1 Tax=Campylobacter lanienae TaxID=75658 RepID=UPI00112FB0B6|nr:hypothetical protein [Campylobacter lanienae]